MRTAAAGGMCLGTRQIHGFSRCIGQQRSASRVTKVHSQSSNEIGPIVRVDGLVVQPAYRSTPWEAEKKLSSAERDKALLLFVSESGICRAPLAVALFQQQLQHSPLRDWIEVQQRATRDYCAGDGPDPSAIAAAATFGAQLAAANGAASPDSILDSSNASGAVVFDPANDIVAADLVLVMDKYTAADVLREVSSYDLINPGGQYSARVRLLGSYHPLLAKHADQTDGQDLDDPLYGNVGGDQEQATVLEIAQLIQQSCSCLVQQLEQLAEANGLLQETSTTAAPAASSNPLHREDEGTAHNVSGNGAAGKAASAGARFREVLIKSIREDGVINWLVPPMLQGSSTDMGGWV